MIKAQKWISWIIHITSSNRASLQPFCLDFCSSSFRWWLQYRSSYCCLTRNRSSELWSNSWRLPVSRSSMTFMLQTWRKTRSRHALVKRLNFSSKERCLRFIPKTKRNLRIVKRLDKMRHCFQMISSLWKMFWEMSSWRTRAANHASFSFSTQFSSCHECTSWFGLTTSRPWRLSSSIYITTCLIKE